VPTGIRMRAGETGHALGRGHDEATVTIDGRFHLHKVLPS